LFGTDLNQIYDPATDTWDLGTPMPVSRFQLKVAVVNDILFAMGGMPFFNLQGTWSPENYKYTPIGYVPEFPSWIILPLIIVATLIAVFARKMLVGNGMDEKALQYGFDSDSLLFHISSGSGQGIP
jgi:hypothetical protein